MVIPFQQSVQQTKRDRWHLNSGRTNFPDFPGLGYQPHRAWRISIPTVTNIPRYIDRDSRR